MTGGYRENKLSPLDAPFPADLKDHTSEYDYFSDSDLDEYDDVEGDDDEDESEVSLGQTHVRSNQYWARVYSSQCLQDAVDHYTGGHK